MARHCRPIDNENSKAFHGRVRHERDRGRGRVRGVLVPVEGRPRGTYYRSTREGSDRYLKRCQTFAEGVRAAERSPKESGTRCDGTQLEMRKVPDAAKARYVMIGYVIIK